MLERVIWDQKNSARSFDDNGYLHISLTPISKATVNPYKGSELQGLTDEELEPERIYYGYRDPKELEKGASTFNGLFLLDEHHNIDSVDIPREYIIGTVGTDAQFKDGYLYNSLTIADAEAIKNVKEKTKWEISSAYRFTPVFKGGDVELGGESIHYDFVMTNIRGNHVALVPEGRAGHDVRVADSKENVMEEKQEKCPVCNADQMNMALDCLGACALEDFKAKVNGNDRFDIKVITEIKNERGDLTAVVCGNKGHQFIVGYDSFGNLDAEELINDAMASKVREAVNIGKKAKEEEDNAKKAFKYDVQKAVEEQRDCPAPVPTMYDPIEHKEIVVGNPDCIAHEVIEHEAKKAEAVMGLIGDEAMQTAGNAGVPAAKQKQSIVDEKGAKGMGDNIERDDSTEKMDQHHFDDLKEELADTAYENVEALKNELKKWDVEVGLTKVAGGKNYTIKCTKGEKAFTVEYKQRKQCVEIVNISDEGEADYPKGVEANEEQVEEDSAIQDGGPGSGRKPGSKNGMGGNYVGKHGGRKMRFTPEEKEEIAIKFNNRHEEDGADIKHAKFAAEYAEKEHLHRAQKGPEAKKQKEMHNARLARRLRAGLDAKPKCVSDAKPEHSVYDLLVSILAEPAEKQ